MTVPSSSSQKESPLLIKTDRLLLRIPNLTDAPKINDSIIESYDNLKHWLTWVTSLHELKDTEAFINSVQKSYYDRKSIALSIWLEGDFIGMCSFQDFDWKSKNVKIGYWCKTTAQGNGYISESVAALTCYGFHMLGLSTVSICCEETNTKSQRITLHGGFKLIENTKLKIFSPQKGKKVIACVYIRQNANGVNKPLVTGGW